MNPSAATSNKSPHLPLSKASPVTLRAVSWIRRPITLVGHSPDETSIVAKTHVVRVLPSTNVRISSAWSSVSSKPRSLSPLNRRAAREARSYQRATVFQGTPITRGIADLLTPSTDSAATVSKSRRDRWMRW